MAIKHNHPLTIHMAATTRPPCLRICPFLFSLIFSGVLQHIDIKWGLCRLTSKAQVLQGYSAQRQHPRQRLRTFNSDLITCRSMVGKVLGEARQMLS
eukprot:scaffold114630_cov43-Prasinocladus_malaysianus.AAC.1